MEIYLSTQLSNFTKICHFKLDDYSKKVKSLLSIAPSNFLLGKDQYFTTEEYFKLIPETALGPFFFDGRMEYCGSTYYLDYGLEDDEVYPLRKEVEEFV